MSMSRDLIMFFFLQQSEGRKSTSWLKVVLCLVNKSQLTYWFPNSEDTNKKPVFRTHMAVATGMVSKYFSRISVT